MCRRPQQLSVVKTQRSRGPPSPLSDRFSTAFTRNTSSLGLKGFTT
jgi:hypothetical protein